MLWEFFYGTQAYSIYEKVHAVENMHTVRLEIVISEFFIWRLFFSVEFVVEASVGPRASPVIRLEQRAPDKLGGARDCGGDCVVGKVRIGDWSFRFDVRRRRCRLVLLLAQIMLMRQ